MEDQGAGEECLVNGIACGPFSIAGGFSVSLGFHLSGERDCAEGCEQSTYCVLPNSAHTCVALPMLYYVIQESTGRRGKEPSDQSRKSPEPNRQLS